MRSRQQPCARAKTSMARARAWAPWVFCAAVALAGSAGARLDIKTATEADGEVALFTTETVMDIPGGATVTNRLEIQCSGGAIHYIVVDFGTPRMAEQRRSLETELRQRSGGGEAQRAPWRVHYDALAWHDESASNSGSLKNLQLNRMVHRGDDAAWLRRLVDAPYLSIERPAQGDASFLFELSHVTEELQRLRPYCGIAANRPTIAKGTSSPWPRPPSDANGAAAVRPNVAALTRRVGSRDVIE